MSILCTRQKVLFFFFRVRYELLLKAGIAATFEGGSKIQKDALMRYMFVCVYVKAAQFSANYIPTDNERKIGRDKKQRG